MKIAYFDCAAGISGDMTLGAFLGAGLAPAVLEALPDMLHLENVRIDMQQVVKCGIAATKVDVQAPEQHAHRHLRQIEEIVEASALPAKAKNTALAIFNRLAAAEARVHDQPVEKVHFHEVGAVDAIIDICGAALAFAELGIEKAYCGSISVGGGQVKMAHGTYPVPAPATAYLLESFKIVHGPVDRELATPTGAAILAATVDAGTPPPYTLHAAGYGAGTLEIENIPNVLRILIGETVFAAAKDEVVVLECAIDDMSGELFPDLLDALLVAGAVDAFLTPVIMKKGRPGMKVTVLCAPAVKSEMQRILFRESTTIGIREYPAARTKLQRQAVRLRTSFGEMIFKKIALPDGSLCYTPEYSECKRVASEQGAPLRRVYEIALRDASQQGKFGDI